MQLYVGITWKSKIAFVNALAVSWHPVPWVYSASCLLRGLRCNQLQVAGCKTAELSCFPLFFGTVLQITHWGPFWGLHSSCRDNSLPMVRVRLITRRSLGNQQETFMPVLTCHHICDENGNYLLPEVMTITYYQSWLILLSWCRSLPYTLV